MQGKLPAVKGYARFGLKASEQLAFKFPEIDALAFMAGGRTKITVVDIDSNDEDLLRDTLKRHGQTPIIVRSGSGNFQAWYRFNGEGRAVRPDPSIPVDLLGGGVVVAPPSQGSKGTYQFIRGGLADLDQLRPAANIISFPKGKIERPEMQRVAPGGRNIALRDHLRSQARYCDDLDALLDVAHSFVADRLDTVSKPFPESEVIATAKSVWAWTQDRIAAGEYWVGTGQRLTLSFEAIDKVLPLGADATALYLTLQRRSNHRGELIVANDMRLTMPDGEWTLVRFRRARGCLIAAGIITETKKASTWHGATRYSWGQG